MESMCINQNLPHLVAITLVDISKAFKDTDKTQGLSRTFLHNRAHHNSGL